MTAGHRAPLGYHARLLADPHRMDAFERALRALVRPGDVVLDLGCGTGVLAMLAARRGARVHAVESMAVAGLAEKLVAANGLAERITVHCADATALAPVEPVDLVVSDFLGCFLVDDWMLPAAQAAGRWLKPGGRFCPSEVRLFVAPVGDFGLPPVEIFSEPFYGIDLSAALPRALSACHIGNLAPSTLLADAQEYHCYTPPSAPGRFDRELRFRLRRGGLLRALGGWFVATLAPGVVLSTEPGVETHWGQYLFPLPLRAVQAEDELRVRLSLVERGSESMWRWEGELTRGGAAIESFAIEEATLDD